MSQVDEPTRAVVRMEGRQTRGNALGVALAERLHRDPSREVDLSQQFSRLLWDRIVAVANGTDPIDAAQPFTPYDGRGRRTVAHLLLTAAHAAAANQVALRSPVDEVRRMAVARDALTNAAGREFVSACWVDEPIGRVRRPKLEGEPHLVAARLVVALGLGECLLCDEQADGSVRAGRHARAPLYCEGHAGTSTKLRAHHRDVMHDVLEHAARYYGIRRGNRHRPARTVPQR